MSQSLQSIETLEKVVERIFQSPTSIAHWCDMCGAAAALIDRHTVLHDGCLNANEAFRKAIGYLTVSPKPLGDAAGLSHEELERRMSFEEGERHQMLVALAGLDRALYLWAVEMDGDEEEPVYDSDRVAFATFVVGFNAVRVKDGADRSLFKDALGMKTFRNYYFRKVGMELSGGAIAPAPREPSVAPPSDMTAALCGYLSESIGIQRDICTSTKVIAGDALTDGATHARAGTAGQTSQEDEVRRRYLANGQRGLRGLVAQVLRESAWQLPGGHPSTPDGRAKCYNRVYAILNPRHRGKTAKPRPP